MQNGGSNQWYETKCAFYTLADSCTGLTSFMLSFMLLAFRWCNWVNPDLHGCAGQCSKRRNGCRCAALAVDGCVARRWVLLHPCVSAPQEVPAPWYPIGIPGHEPPVCSWAVPSPRSCWSPLGWGEWEEEEGDPHCPLPDVFLIWRVRCWFSFTYFTPSRHLKKALKWE